MRTFLLRNQVLTSCGNKSGRGDKGISYFCSGCGEIWGKVNLGWMEWVAARIPCGACGAHGYTWKNGTCAGSFLKPLTWWDEANGLSLSAQLQRADVSLLLYEAEKHIEWEISKSEEKEE
jgi:hypothetical protein